jgi:riboflavin synthase
MFTGLIEALGVVREVRESPYGVRLVVDPSGATGWQHRVTAGESIAVAGVCLTARHPERILPHGDPLPPGDPLAFDVVAETLRKTTLGALKPGARANLERAVRADTLMGGHFVQGHVDGVGSVSGIRDDPADWRLSIHLPATLMEAMVPKGSVAVEGVSLTLAEVRPDGPGLAAGTIEIALIPTTLERTTLGGLRVGDPVNIEADMLAKSVVATVRRMRPGLDALP